MARRKIIRIRVTDLEAGDTIVIKERTIRKFYHVCEYHQIGRDIYYVYKVRGEFVRVNARPKDAVRIIE